MTDEKSAQQIFTFQSKLNVQRLFKHVRSLWEMKGTIDEVRERENKSNQKHFFSLAYYGKNKGKPNDLKFSIMHSLNCVIGSRRAHRRKLIIISVTFFLCFYSSYD